MAPVASTASAVGPLSCALAAGALSPAKPDAPEPATTLKAPPGGILRTMIPRIGDIQDPAGVHGDSHRPFEGRGGAIAGCRRDQSVRRDLADAVVARIGDIKVAGPYRLPVRRAC